MWETFWPDPQSHVRWAWDVVCAASSETRRSMIVDSFPGISAEDLDRASHRLDQVCAERARSAILYGAAGQVSSPAPTTTPVPWGWVIGSAVVGVGVGWVAKSLL